jgi:hypothetical protein
VVDHPVGVRKDFDVGSFKLFGIPTEVRSHELEVNWHRPDDIDERLNSLTVATLQSSAKTTKWLISASFDGTRLEHVRVHTVWNHDCAAVLPLR